MYANLFVNGNGLLGKLVGTSVLEMVLFVPELPDENGKRQSLMLHVLGPWALDETDVVILDEPALGSVEFPEL
jgi:Mrp family chromosome partitioning ATPase